MSWGMEIARRTDQDPADMVRQFVLDASRLLGDFATPIKGYWMTTSAGEYASIRDLSEDRSDALDELAAAHFPDLIAQETNLSLLVRFTADGDDYLLINAGYLRFEYEDDIGPTGGVYVNLVLDADIYARRTRRANSSDNRALADLNAPRLNRYLRALQGHFAQTFTYVEHQGYEGQIDSNGFIGHDDPIT